MDKRISIFLNLRQWVIGLRLPVKTMDFMVRLKMRKSMDIHIICLTIRIWLGLHRKENNGINNQG